ncbi:peptidase S8 and S53, subtilisin, kexin, sedolisin [Luminiphilus syltensis NOR5-1B]|uniref:Peptidase S8 and S53, subtilisin, kexin, sedolisin n=1 Tax=Luminiphilus syltensis NOR5-1B TaxID=565045 RepID=B8KTN1_9GAMM|nr:S8 family serine peptidase [Luminiphilus syltensis]EED36873.1 peptidase S8 and S53, subtilisin, kexin, sedolisin [Luminiphilus syltensis NOR5-1B]
MGIERATPGGLVTLLLTVSLLSCGGGGGGGGGGENNSASPPAPNQCQLVLLAAEGVAIESESAQFNCAAGQRCEFTITVDGFSENFSATTASGYQFAGWGTGDRNLCPNQTGTCNVTAGDLATPLCVTTAASDGEATLEALATLNKNAFSVSGQLSVLAGSVIDDDTNNRDNGLGDNNTLSGAQSLGNPATIGGYLNAPGEGPSGQLAATGDLDDFFRIEAFAGQSATLIIADFDTADIDLYLYNEQGEIIDFSVDTGEIEQVAFPANGVYFLNPFLFAGASSYNLVVGNANIGSRSRVVPGEIIAQFSGEGVLKTDEAASRRRSALQRFGLRQRGGGLGRERLLAGDKAFGPGSSQDVRVTEIHNALSHDKALKDQWGTWLLAKRLGGYPGVAGATPNRVVKAFSTPNDEFLGLQWHYPLIKLASAWDITAGDPGVIVAVLDSGVIAHPELDGRLVSGYDFISDSIAAGDGDGIDPDPTDEGRVIDEETGAPVADPGGASYHGTHVAGTVVARGNNSLGIAGVAYNARVMPLRALSDDGGTTYDVLQAVRFAAGLENDSGILPAQPAAIINLSLGGSGFSNTEQALFSRVAEQGVLVVAASGNDGNSQVDFPAGYYDVIAVGAVDLQGRATDYSNQGPALDLTAPGGDLQSDLNGDGYPDGVLSLGVSEGQPAYVFAAGTSMAAPHVAGVLALMRSVNPDLSGSDIVALLNQGQLSDDTGEPGRDDTYGWGVINAQKAVDAALESLGSTVERTPLLTVSTGSLNFGAVRSELELVVSNAGGGSLDVTEVVANQPWVTPRGGATDANGLGVWRIGVNRQSLADGTYRATVTFRSSSGNRNVDITMQVDSDSTGDIGTVYVLVYDPLTNEAVAETRARPEVDYQYQLAELPEGLYEIWAGTDNDNDFEICDAGDTCGAFRTIDSPVLLEVDTDRESIDFSSDFIIDLRSVTASSSKSSKDNSEFRVKSRITP